MVGAAAAIGGAVVGAYGSKKAADAGTSASEHASEAQQQMFDKQVELNKPFREGGLAAQNRLLELLGVGGDKNAAGYGSASKQFSINDFKADPGYAFRLNEGLKALDKQAAARGGLISGGALKAAERYGQGVASDEFTNAFNRYQTNRSNLINPLLSVMGAGQTATNTLSNAAQRTGEGIAEAGYQGANARASGYAGMANAVNSGVSNYMNYSQNQDYMNMLKNKQVG